MLFIDTSSLVKYYYPEPVNAEVEAVILHAEQIYVSNLTIVEMASALQRKVENHSSVLSCQNDKL